MILKNLIKSTFENIVTAQYEAYLYSMELKGKQAEDDLFPIPMAKASEITLQFQYAYIGEPIESMENVLDKKQFLNHVQKNTEQVVRQGINYLIDYTEDNNPHKPESWPEIKEGLKGKALENYTVKQIMEELNTNYGKLVNEQNVFDKDTYNSTVRKHFNKSVLNHPDLNDLNYTPGDKQLVRGNLPSLEEKATELENNVSKKISQRIRKDTGIVVDAEVLKTLPKEAIQTMNMTINMHDLEEIKVPSAPKHKQER